MKGDLAADRQKMCLATFATNMNDVEWIKIQNRAT